MKSTEKKSNEINVTENSKEKLNEACSLVNEAASDMIEHAKEKAKDKINVNKQQIDDVSDKTERFIKEKPLLSIGCAFAAGWAIAKILK